MSGAERVWLHIGVPKSGTSALQRYLGDNAAEVAAQGLTYLAPKRKKSGNDLSTPVEAYDFPGLKAGDRWCICLPRWIEALEEGIAPKILLRSTDSSVLEHVPLEVLEKYAIRDD